MKFSSLRCAARVLPCLALFTLLVPVSGVAKEPTSSDGYSTEIQIEPLLRTSKTSSGAPITYPSTTNPQVTALRVTIPPGASTGWHEHPSPCYAYILSGVLTLELRDRMPLVSRKNAPGRVSRAEESSLKRGF